VYYKPLPSIRSIRQLAELDGPFPMHCQHIVSAAERFWFGDSMISFLKLFPPDEPFQTRDEFVERCKQLELLIREEQETSPELLRSP